MFDRRESAVRIGHIPAQPTAEVAPNNINSAHGEKCVNLVGSHARISTAYVGEGDAGDARKGDPGTCPSLSHRRSNEMRLRDAGVMRGITTIHAAAVVIMMCMTTAVVAQSGSCPASQATRSSPLLTPCTGTCSWTMNSGSYVDSHTHTLNF